MPNLRIYLLIFMNRLKEAEMLLEREKSSLNPELKLLKARLALKREEFSLAKNWLEQVDDQFQNLDTTAVFQFLVTRSSYNWAIRNIDLFRQDLEAIDEIFLDLAIPSSIVLDYYHAEYLHNKGIFHLLSQNWEKALTLQQRSSVINTKIGNIASIGANYNAMAVIYIRQGQYSDAMMYLKKAGIVFRQIDDKKALALILNNIGGILQTKGNLHSSMKCYEQSLELAEKYNNMDLKGKILNNLGNIFLNQGKLEKAEESYTKSIEIKNEIDQDEGLAASYHNMGKLYRSLGQYSKSLEYFDIAFDLLTDELQSPDVIYTLVEKISLFCEMGRIEQAKSLLPKLGQLAKQQDQPLSYQQHNYAKAVIMAHSHLQPYQLAAQRLFGEIIQEENLNFEITLNSLIFYLELTIQLSQSLPLPNSRAEIEEKIDLIYKIAQLNHSLVLVADVLLLKAKLAYFQRDLDRMEYFVTQSEIIAWENGLSQLQEKIDQFVDLLYSGGPKTSNLDLLSNSLSEMKRITTRL